MQKFRKNIKTAEWKHIEFEETIPEFSVDNDFTPRKLDLEDLPRLRKSYLARARHIASELERQEERPFFKDSEDIEDLKSFYYIHRA